MNVSEAPAVVEAPAMVEAPWAESEAEGHVEGAHGGGFEILSVHEFSDSFFTTLLAILFFIMLITLVRAFLHHAKKLEFLPESGWLILLGCVIGVILTAASGGEGTALDSVFSFDSKIFFLVLIPPIIFEAGYHLRSTFFFGNIGVILLYAVIGTLLNTAVVGLALWGISTTGIFVYEISVVDSLVFGSLIAAVDPVAVLAIFEAVHVNETLNILVFGESVLNDAVSIVLYRLFLSLRDAPEITSSLPVLAIVKFFVVSLGGVAMGFFFAILAAFMTKFTSHVPMLEVVLVGVCALLSYELSEGVGLSGIMAILFCGIVMTRYVEENLSKYSHITLDYMMKLVAGTAESLIFVYLGISTVSQWFVKPLVEDTLTWDPVFTVLTVVLIIPARFAITFLLTAFANRYRLKRVSVRDQLILAFSGLRGAIAFALAFILPAGMKSREVIIATTLVVIWLSVFVMGGSVKPMIKFFKVKRAQEEGELNLAHEVLPRVVQPLHDLTAQLVGGHTNRFVDLFRFLDRFVYKRVVRRREYARQSERNLLRWVEKQRKNDERDRVDELFARMANRNTPPLDDSGEMQAMSVLDKRALAAHAGVGGPAASSSLAVRLAGDDTEYNARSHRHRHRGAHGRTKNRHLGQNDPDVVGYTYEPVAGGHIVVSTLEMQQEAILGASSRRRSRHHRHRRASSRGARDDDDDNVDGDDDDDDDDDDNDDDANDDNGAADSSDADQNGNARHQNGHRRRDDIAELESGSMRSVASSGSGSENEQ